MGHHYSRNSSSEDGVAVAVTSGVFNVWSAYEGVLDSGNVEIISSSFNGAAVIVELAPEGSNVKKGDVLARFDGFQIQQDINRLEHDCAVAQSELAGLRDAELPLELSDLETQRLEAQCSYNAEQKYLIDSRELLSENLVSDAEVAQQELKVKSLLSKYEQIDHRITLTRKHLHPARMEKTKAQCEASQRQLELARMQLAGCAIAAPTDGTVVYIPVPMENGYRAVRVGDSVYKNQPFMCLPDMDNLIASWYVPESDLSRVEPGCMAVVSPLSYPSMSITGAVERVGAMAQERPNYPAWQKYFYVTMNLKGSDPRLRSGISAVIHVLSYQQPNAILIPRPAVRWENEKPHCLVQPPGNGIETRPLHLGRANDQYYEVISGVADGEICLIP
jgi:multidrug resistance efflux pump